MVREAVLNTKVMSLNSSNNARRFTRSTSKALAFFLVILIRVCEWVRFCWMVLLHTYNGILSAASRLIKEKNERKVEREK